MKLFIIKLFIILSLLSFLIWFLIGTSGNLDWIKERAKDTWHTHGFKVVAYEGYSLGFWGLNSYGGAKVWHRLKKIPDNGITYSGCLYRWGDEVHVYGPKAAETISLLKTKEG